MKAPGAAWLFWRALALLALAVLAAPARAETVHVRAVHDGDTVLLADGRRVRYLGIDAPERGQPFYAEALKLNLALTAGRTVRLEFDRKREDRYGRLLAYVHVGEEMVNARLVREGLAHVYLIPPNLLHAEALLGLQAEAQAKGLGMWGVVPGVRPGRQRLRPPGGPRRIPALRPRGAHLRLPLGRPPAGLRPHAPRRPRPGPAGPRRADPALLGRRPARLEQPG
ncbi:MAG: thermonuclease family protein [Candidatus Rokubacteria bacterium]|nr:thermonuclease family protein [Candidatus Rokubacteria bacterium]